MSTKITYWLDICHKQFFHNLFQAANIMPCWMEESTSLFSSITAMNAQDQTPWRDNQELAQEYNMQLAYSGRDSEFEKFLHE